MRGVQPSPSSSNTTTPEPRSAGVHRCRRFRGNFVEHRFQKSLRVRSANRPGRPEAPVVGEIYDGLLRPRQTQTQLRSDDQYPNGGRLVTLTEYDSRGLPVAVHGPAFNEQDASAEAVMYFVAPAPGTTRTIYDGAGRPVASTFTAQTEAGSQTPGEPLTLTTTTVYGGDRVKTTPPSDAEPVKPATTTVFDARGQVKSLTEHAGGAGKDRVTTYTWTPAGRPDTMADGAGNVWSWTWNLQGERTSATDPAAGTTRTWYDDLGQPTASVDPEGRVLITQYDDLGRRLALSEATTADSAESTLVHTTPVLLSSWKYDTLKPGLPAETVRTLRNPTGTASKDVVTKVSGYDAGDRPTGSTTKVEALQDVIEPELAGDYLTRFAYNQDGSPRHTDLGGYASMKGERLYHGYDSNGRPEFLTGAGSYVADVLRAPTGEGLRYGYGNTFGQAVWLRQAFEPGTRRLTEAWIDREVVDTTDVRTSFAYDGGGNPTKTVTWRDLATGSTEAELPAPSQTECFDYDALRQLTAAWTPASGDCEPAQASTAVLGGPAPYSQTWTFDPRNGNRKSETSRFGPGTGTASTTSTYTYFDADASHRLDRVQTAATGTAVGGLDTFAYDDAGNTIGRTIAAAAVPTDQVLTWSAEGKPTRIATTGGAVLEENWYDVDGTRIVRRDATSTTLFLGDAEIVRTRTGTPATTWKRYYDFDGQTVAVRDGNHMSDVQILLGDRHNTGTWAVEAAGGKTAPILHRPTTPYGGTRASTGGTWTSQRGFVGGTLNPSTGLTQIGARQYDPTTGRFLSVDPILDLANPAHQNPYAYAGNNPLVFADPTGLYWGEDKVNAARDFGVSVVSTVVNQVENVVNDVIGPVAAGIPCGLRPCGYTPEINVSGQLDRLGNPDSPAGRVGKVMGNLVAPVKAGGGVKTLLGTLGRGTKKPAPAAPLVSQAEQAARLGAGTAAKACSFTAPTLVLMADGTSRPIGEVEVGDLVLATDPETGEQAAKPVEEVFVHQDAVADLVVDGHVLSTTEDHPFWSVTDQRFERADELSDGEQVLAADGRILTVAGLNPDTTRTTTAYNLAIADIHTYHVGADEVLVHNTCRISPLGAKDFGPKGVHVHASDGSEIALRPGANGIVPKPVFGRTMSATAQREVIESLADAGFRGRLLTQLRTALPGMSSSPDRLVRNRAIEVHRLIKWLEKE
ncbi:MAG: RHS repeat-associated core domain-containing protein [Sporichthyaceae bacterium]